jgi:hypothetical protein
MPTLTEENIQRIFGHEDALAEDLARLKEYYFKSRTYDKIRADLPLRILVGHKGIGKSALFQVAMSEDKEEGQLPIFVRPDDVSGIEPETSGFLSRIKNWKYGLQAIIAKKTLDMFGMKLEGKTAEAINAAGRMVGILKDVLRPYSETKIDLTPTEKMLITKFLKKSAGITVYLDDLDRGWKGRREDIVGLSALVNAVRDLSSENPGLKFKLSLRSDVYFLLRTSDESTDKFEGSVVWFSWTNQEILALLVKRIQTFIGNEVDEKRLLSLPQGELVEYLKPVMVPIFRGQGRWKNVSIHKVLISVIRKRPRDLVKLCSLAAHHAADHDREIIMTEDFRAILEEYSHGRVQDTVIEFNSELPDIERLILNMKPNQVEKRESRGYIYKTDALINKIKKISEQGRFVMAGNREASPTELAQFLYKINFLTARKILETGEIDRKYFEENRYVLGHSADYGYNWEVHPAFRWALQPDTVENIFDEVGLSAS